MAVNILGPLSEIESHDCERIPFGMYGAKCVVIKDIVYVGGGCTAMQDGVNNIVFKYIVKDDVWIVLPPCTVTRFGLTEINGKLVTVGGRDILSGGKPTAVCFEFDPETDSWNRSACITEMPTARYSLDCANHGQAIVAVGGMIENDEPCNEVEVFSIEGKQWSSACPIPFFRATTPKVLQLDTPNSRYVPSSLVSSGGTISTNSSCMVIDDHFFVKRNYTIVRTHIGSVSANQQPDSTEWEMLGSFLNTHSPLVNLSGCLACLGKDPSGYEKLLVYVSSLQAWLPLYPMQGGSYEYRCAAVLSNGNILFIGGKDKEVSHSVIRVSVV